MREFEQYIKAVEEQIRCKRAVPCIEEELKSHLEDQKEALIRDGMEEEKACKEAVRQMGDPVEVGVMLDRIHRPKMEKSLLAIVIILSIVGALLQFLARGPWKSYILFMGIGLIIMIGMYFIDYSILATHPFLFWFGIGAGGILFVLFSGRGMINGSFGYQTQQILLLFAPAYGGILYYFRGKKYKGIFLSLLFLLLPFSIVIYTVNLSGFFILFPVFLFMLGVSVWKGWFGVKKIFGMGIVCSPIVVGALTAVFAYGSTIIKSYQKVRIEAFWNPEKYAKGAGYLTYHLRNMSSGLKWFGEGMGTNELVELPSMHSDYIVFFLVYHFGMAAGILIVSFLLYLIGRMFKLSMRQKNRLGTLVGMGCTGVFFVETVSYILMNFGKLPAFRAYMPFLSSGRGQVIHYLLIGVMLSVYGNTNVITEKTMGFLHATSSSHSGK